MDVTCQPTSKTREKMPATTGNDVATQAHQTATFFIDSQHRKKIFHIVSVDGTHHHQFTIIQSSIDTPIEHNITLFLR